MFKAAISASGSGRRSKRKSIAVLRAENLGKRVHSVCQEPTISSDNTDACTSTSTVSDSLLVDVDAFVVEHDAFLQSYVQDTLSQDSLLVEVAASTTSLSPPVSIPSPTSSPMCLPLSIDTDEAQDTLAQDSLEEVVDDSSLLSTLPTSPVRLPLPHFTDERFALTSIEIAAQLEQLGLRDHLIFALQRQDAHMKTVINRFALLIEWLVTTQQLFLPCTLQSLQAYIKLFIAEEYDLLSPYAQHLSQHKHYQPATVVGHIDDIRICCMWFVLFRTKITGSDTRMRQPDMLGFLTAAKHLRRILNKKVS